MLRLRKLSLSGLMKITFFFTNVLSENTENLSIIKFQELPDRWETLKKQSDLARHTLAPLKANEIVNIKKKVARFELREEAYQDKFSTYSFFRLVYKKYN